MAQKNVLAFVPEFPVISETFIERELFELSKLPEINLTILSTRKGKGETKLKNVIYKKISVLHILLGISFFLTKPTKTFKAAKILGIKNFYLFVKSLGYTWVFFGFKPQIIYTQFLSDSSSIALAASIILGTELGISAHARDITDYPHLVLQKAKAAKFITICNKKAHEYLIAKLPEELHRKVKLIYHGFNPQEYSGIERISNLRPFILTVGRLVEKKGHAFLIQALKILKNSGQNIDLIVIGYGPLEKELKGLVERLNLQENVKFLGALPFSETKKYLVSCFCYVQPGVDLDSADFDGVPNVLIEAAIAKAPLVVTDSGSTLDFLDSSNAIIVSQKDPEAIARGILSVEGDSKLVENAYLKATEMFDLNKNVSEIAKLL